MPVMSARVLVGLVLVAILVVASPLAVLAQDQAATPVATPGATPGASPVATPGASPVASPGTAARPTDAQLRQAGVNELGVVPVLMYHTFTSNPENVTEWTRTLNGFRDQLQQLYDLGFTTISMRDLLENRIDVPLGRHPIVLTFDDSSASQFLIDQQPDGTITPRPNSAVGVMEAFFASHPDFGHSAMFAVVPNYCFADADIDALNAYSSCDAKIGWLVNHGYEIANHTLDHTNLGTVDIEGFVHEVGGTIEWIDQRVSGPANLSRVLVLPYGGRAPRGSRVSEAMNGWFRYDGNDYTLDAIVDVSGGPMYSPSSTWFKPGRISRINSDPASFDYLVHALTSGNVTFYTSDGNPDTVTVPNPIPEFLANEFDATAIQASGKTLVRYDVEAGASSSATVSPVASQTPATAGALAVGGRAATTDSGVRLRTQPGTDGTIVQELATGSTLTIVGGPVSTGGETWWQVETTDGKSGWVVAEYLKPTS